MIRATERIDRPVHARDSEESHFLDYVLAMAGGALGGLLSWRANDDPYEVYRAHGQDQNRGRTRRRAGTRRASCRPRERSEPSSPSECSERPARSAHRRNVRQCSRNSRSPSTDPAMPPLGGDGDSGPRPMDVPVRQAPAPARAARGPSVTTAPTVSRTATVAQRYLDDLIMEVVGATP